jgi:hypothetical protein
MSQLDLINALTWKSEWSLRARIEDAKDELNQIGWGQLDEKYLLAVLRAAVDLDIYEGKATDVADSLRKDNTLLDDAVNGLKGAANFLKEHCDVLSLDLLLYSYQAVLLGDILRRHPNPSVELTRQLIQWFWWTTASSTFAGISGYRLTSMQRYLRELADGKKGAWPRRRTERTPASDNVFHRQRATPLAQDPLVPPSGQTRIDSPAIGASGHASTRAGTP